MMILEASPLSLPGGVDKGCGTVLNDARPPAMPPRGACAGVGSGRSDPLRSTIGDAYTHGGFDDDKKNMPASGIRIHEPLIMTRATSVHRKVAIRLFMCEITDPVKRTYQLNAERQEYRPASVDLLGSAC
ncbi:hypothetical protein [Tardibacter chloracetimidivorans]|uniref:hypothetical protein n=1 Tax=Tardibacter chloracetimidivorans TaxID=1921510 RepID=UPI001D057E08|nr:hypothetical protein [Tardibacter chloracetimidivorans]